MRVNVDCVTISIDDVWKLLEAEEALKPFIPDAGIPGARSLWDFFERIHRAALQTQDLDLESFQIENKAACEVISRRKSDEYLSALESVLVNSLVNPEK